MNWKNRVFENFRLYCITDLFDEDPAIFKKVESAYRGGADIVQLRSKTLSDRALFRMGLRFRELADRYHKLFFVNDRPDLVLAVGADGVHLGQEDLPTEAVRRIFKGKKIWVGRSTHSLSQALQAASDGVDYIGVGPIFETPTKPAYPAVGLKLVRQVRKKINLPFVCIGGIDHKNISQVLAAGATRAAFVRAVFQARDIYQATRTFKEAILEYDED